MSTVKIHMTVADLLQLAIRERELYWVGGKLPPDLQQELDKTTATLRLFRDAEVVIEVPR